MRPNADRDTLRANKGRGVALCGGVAVGRGETSKSGARSTKGYWHSAHSAHSALCSRALIVSPKLGVVRGRWKQGGMGVPSFPGRTLLSMVTSLSHGHSASPPVSY